MVEQADTREPFLKKSEVSGYASASLLSKAVWYWMNPVLSKGYKSPLRVDDIPSLAPEHRAERLSLLFESKWPKPEDNSKHPVPIALFWCFWKDLAFTAFLAIVKLFATYIGPVLINKFVEYTAGQRSSRYEGYYLLVILFLSKFTELSAGHHFNFLSMTLGLKIRSALITSLYKKSLKLSCSARQNHGVGPMVSYMAVDAQQISDVIPQLHAMWLTPLQICIALVLLYSYFGIAVLSASLVVVLVLCFSLYVTKGNNIKQYFVMKNRDERLKATSEMLNNMRVIKFQAWETHFNKRIHSCRDEEFTWLSKFWYWISSNLVVLWSTSLVLSTALFGTAILMGQPLLASTVFTATTTLRTLQEPLRNFPQSMISFSQAMISLGRLDTYMMSKELDSESVERAEGCDGNTAVQVEDGMFAWDDDKTEAVLKYINFEVKKGEITAIVGTVGSGKSSLLASITGEMHKLSGKVRVCGTTAYVAQTSWIQNGTIEENILFGLPMNREKYIETLRVCCLEKDLEMLEYGDQTEIGERGINLSGGQKQRIQLARAVYQDCDIYLLDDVFSAVDAQTGSDLFRECLRGALRGKTILLVTHQVDFLHNVDLILVMRDGMVVQSGKYNALLNSGLDFGALVAAHETSMEVVEKGETLPGGSSPRTPKSPHQVSSPHGEAEVDYNSVDQASPDIGTSKLIKDEEKETGTVSWSLYKQYCTEALGWWGVAAVVILSTLWQGSMVCTDFWLKYETTPSRSFNPSRFMGVYGIIAAISILMLMGRTFLVTIMGLKTAQKFFSNFLHCILHAPMSFFDTTPTGRILSRASSDQANLDFTLPFFMSLSIIMYTSLLTVICITCIYAWPTVILLVPLAFANYWYRGYYLASSRELTRLDQITKAPVIHHFSESIYGFMTIRAFQKQDRFCEENLIRVNSNLRMAFHNNASSEWLGFRLEFLGSLFFCTATMFMIILPSSMIDPSSIGLSLSYGMGLDSVLFYFVYISCMLENQMVSVERLRQFTKIPSEAPWEIKDRHPPSNWPGHGNVDIKDLQVRYRPNTPLVLKGITIGIRGGEKIGVVGRTGSGKSTLIQVFFRLVEPAGGRIIIDDLDISLLGLHDVRSRLGIIPQEPVLFEGTVRSNIDPIGQHTDDEIWKSLERCQLMDAVAAKPEKLDALVVDHGDNWSVGQKQLLCLGRVMLKRSRLLFMDEATASVDSQTDAVIQKIIREDFAACTIISIAHRIPTVMDCDRVLVIDAGWAKEFDKPSRLLERPTIFAALVQEYSNRSEEL